MPLNPVITLTTDFGYSDPFAGIMKGVISGINPDARVIDLTHGIHKFDIRQAALTIGMSYRHFRRDTIHIVVVDPDVGSERRPILVAAEGCYFIGPDNGVFSVIYNESSSCTVLNITAEHYFIRRASRTFHGRDIFAPVAAWLSKSFITAEFGSVIKDFVRLPMNPPSLAENGGIEGEVVYIDHFGNAVTNIGAGNIDVMLRSAPAERLDISFKYVPASYVQYYGQGMGRRLSALINSMDCLELFVREGDASSEFRIKVGDPVRIAPAKA